MNIILTNNEIYNYANALVEQFSNKDIKLPIKVNFYLQKNQTELLSLAQEIEKQRIEIIQELGIQKEGADQIEVPPEKIPEATEKINDLFDLTQEVKIYKVNLDAFGDIELTAGQMQALLFMIDDEEGDNK